MSANLVANVTVNGNLLVQGPYANVQYMNATTSNLFVFATSTVNLGGTPISVIAGGRYFSAVILANGTVRTFGNNAQGGIGVNDTTSRLTPVQVWGISSSATAVACGMYHTAVVLADGTVRTFGNNGRGQLGVNDTTTRLTPVQVWGISSSAVAVAGGYFHTAVLLADGTVRTFGTNGFGTLGVNDTTSRLTPVTVLNITTAKAIASGFYHTAVLLANGTVRTFGQNSYGQLGVNDLTNRSTPVQVWGISSSAIAIACGRYQTVVLLADGTIRTVGINQFGVLGVNDTASRSTPVQVWGISSSAVAIACGTINTAVLLVDGTVRTFGYNNNGQLGVNDTTNRLTPVQVWGISSSAVAVAGGHYNTAVLLPDGTVRMFGKNAQGQLGVNDTTSRLTPVQVLNISTAQTVVVSGGYTFNGPIFTSNIGLGLTPSINFQLDMSTDGARKLTTSTWTTGSDLRIKTDIQTANLARCAEIVDSLDLKYFKWNIHDVNDTHSLGWIAQDVKGFFPKSVQTSKDFGLGDFHTLNSDQLIKVLWGALKHTMNEYFSPPVPEAPEVPEPVPEVPEPVPEVPEPVPEVPEPVPEVPEPVPEVPEPVPEVPEPVPEVPEPVPEVPEPVPEVPEPNEAETFPTQQ